MICQPNSFHHLLSGFPISTNKLYWIFLVHSQPNSRHLSVGARSSMSGLFFEDLETWWMKTSHSHHKISDKSAWPTAPKNLAVFWHDRNKQICHKSSHKIEFDTQKESKNPPKTLDCQILELFFDLSDLSQMRFRHLTSNPGDVIGQTISSGPLGEEQRQPALPRRETSDLGMAGYMKLKLSHLDIS